MTLELTVVCRFTLIPLGPGIDRVMVILGGKLSVKSMPDVVKLSFSTFTSGAVMGKKSVSAWQLPAHLEMELPINL